MAGPKALTKQEASDAAKALEKLFALEYISKKRLYLANFLRGLFFSAGTILGAAVMISLLLWALSLPSRIPFIGPIANNIRDTIDAQRK